MDIFLGNAAAKGAVDVPVLDENGELTGELTRKTVHPGGNQVTRIHIDPSWTLAETIIAVTSPDGIWAAHSDEPPAWVEVTGNDGMAQLLASSYGCAVGVPEDWDGPGIGTTVELTQAELDEAAEPIDGEPVEGTEVTGEPVEPVPTEGEPVA